METPHYIVHADVWRDGLTGVWISREAKEAREAIVSAVGLVLKHYGIVGVQVSCGWGGRS